eukprot:evm.model.NODE_32404_length_21628_cov_21.808304.5
MGGFSFMAPPPPSYYRALPERLEGALTHQQLEQVEELGLLADKDDQGVLLQETSRVLAGPDLRPV